MNKKLFIEAISKFTLGFILVAILIFLPAGTFSYWNGWLLVGLLFIPMFIAGIIMLIAAPKLLKSRLKAKEKENTQKDIVAISGLMFIIGFIVAGLDFRFKWMQLPKIIIIIASIIFLISYIIYASVLIENEYLSRTIEIQKGQKVIDTGLYSIVRHPMYMATLFLFLSIPLILGSVLSYIIFLVYPFIIVQRIKNEEKFLEKKLKGYKSYKKKVKYRLIPYIW